MLYVFAIDASLIFFFLMIRRPPRSTLDRSSAASDVYKRQGGGRAAAAARLALGLEAVVGLAHAAPAAAPALPLYLIHISEPTRPY